MKYINNLFLIILLQTISLNSFAQLRIPNSTQNLLIDNELTGISASFDRIGTSISVDGNMAAIAAPKSKGHGVVHLFEHNGTDWINNGFVEPSDGFFDDYFGGSVLLNGNTLFVGSYHNNYLNKIGAVYIYELINGTWVETQKISSPNNVYESHFGIKVKQLNDWLIISASGESKVYVYKKLNENWELHQTLEPSLLVFENIFGYGLEIQNDELFIGAAAYSEQSENDSGIIYYYRLIGDQWILQDSLLPSDLQNENYFGISINIEEDRLLIGSPQAFSTMRSGAAYVFEYINEEWVQVQKVIPDDPELDSWFGSSVYLDAGNTVIGAYRDSEIYSESGAIYLFNLNESTWEQSEKLFSYNPTNNGRFGISVYMENNKILAGGYREHGVGSFSGAVSSFLFSDNSWSSPDTFYFPKGAYNRNMGSSVHIYGNSAIVGTPYNDPTDQSAVLYYELQKHQWVQKSKIRPDDIQFRYDTFSNTLTHNNEIMVVGSKNYAELNEIYSKGAVYIYERNGDLWQQKPILTTGVDDEKFFGQALDMNNQKIIIGAYGTAYIYEKLNGTWQQSIKLWPNTSNIGNFGRAVGIDGDLAVVTGARYDYNNGGHSQEEIFIYKYINGQWQELDSAIPLEKQSGEQFGVSVSIKNNRILVGSPYNSASQDFSGAFYVFEVVNDELIQKHRVTNESTSYVKFGFSVELLQDRAIIAAPIVAGVYNNSGEIHIFNLENNLWINKIILKNQFGKEGDNFAYNISANDNFLIAGIPRSDYQGKNSGSAIVLDISDLDSIFTNSFESGL